jgi:hypothetical protein
MTTYEALQHLKDAHADDAESLAIGVIEAELARLREIVGKLACQSHPLPLRPPAEANQTEIQR